MDKFDVSNGLKIVSADASVKLDLSGAKKPPEKGAALEAKLQAEVDKLYPRGRGEDVYVFVVGDRIDVVLDYCGVTPPTRPKK